MKGAASVAKDADRSKRCNQCSKRSLGATQPHTLAGLGVVTAGGRYTGVSKAGGKAMPQSCRCSWGGSNGPAIPLQLGGGEMVQL